MLYFMIVGRSQTVILGDFWNARVIFVLPDKMQQGIFIIPAAHFSK